MVLGFKVNEISSYKYNIHSKVYDERIRLNLLCLDKRVNSILDNVWRVVSENYDNIGIEWR